MDEQDWAVTAQWCPGVPRVKQTVLISTEGTVWLTAEKSVEPLPGSSLPSGGVSSPQIVPGSPRLSPRPAASRSSGSSHRGSGTLRMQP